jgi:hypothetical protein
MLGRELHPSDLADRPGLKVDLDRWVAAGLLSEKQATAVLEHERTLAAQTMAPPSAVVPARPSRIPVVAEALGYLGGAFAIVGMGLLVAQYWVDMALAGRLALSGTTAAALAGAGFLVHEQSSPALARLRWFAWLLSTAATGLFVGVLAVDGLEVEAASSVVLLCGGAVVLESGILWWWRNRPLQQLTCLGGVVVFVGALVAGFASEGPVGLAVWAVGGSFLVLGLRRRTPLPLLTEGVGAVAVVVGAAITTADRPGFGLAFSVATALGLLALAVVPGLAPDRADQLMLGVLGGISMLQAAPSAVGYFAMDAGVGTGVTTWTLGAVLLFVGSRRLVRLPYVAQVLGGAALVGGAALTGFQWPGFAPLFGMATAVGLVALGMLPGQVLLSVFGSIGLLINVPWAIVWFFPGEGRVPLLLLVSGAVILAIAVLLTRMRGRFREELAGGAQERASDAIRT